MGPSDYYSQLGVNRGATQEEIRKAYRALARRFHPDRNQGNETAEERFREITKAYDVLSDPEQRKMYDRLGPLYQIDQRPPTAEDLGNIVSETISSIFQPKPSKNRKGLDIQYDIQIELPEVMGTSKTIQIAREVQCHNCQGAGAGENDFDNCTDCQGTGKNKRLFRNTCKRCDGLGKIIVKRCKVCGGLGRLDRTQEVQLDIPKGVQAGQKLRLQGLGHDGFGTKGPGDLFLIVQIQPHPVLERQGKDLYCEIPILWNEAILGCHLKIPTLTGWTEIRIPPDTQSHQLFRLIGKGLPIANGFGDLHIRIIIELPQNLTKEQQECLQKFSTMLQSDQTPKCRDFRKHIPINS